jgi:hypothetical protein
MDDTRSGFVLHTSKYLFKLGRVCYITLPVYFFEIINTLDEERRMIA